MLTLIDTQRTLVIDICRYDYSIDPDILQNAGVSLPIIKCSSGVQEDSMFRTHAQKALTKYKKIAVYHWIDPTVPYGAQASFLINMLKSTGYPIAFVMLDFEQWWSDWGKWYQAVNGKIPWTSVPRVANTSLAMHAMGLADLVRASFKTNIYTGMWFINDYTPSSKIWLQKYDTVISAYPKQPAVKTNMTWAQLKPYYPTALPIGVGNIIGQQFTGDRCLLPGVTALSAGRLVNSPLDVSIFDTTYLQSCGVPVIPVSTATPSTVAATTTPVYSVAAVNVNAVNVRSGPGSTYDKVGIKYQNNLVVIYETNNGYTRVGTNQWIYTQYLTPR